MSWSREFENPISLSSGRQLVTLKDGADYIMKLPKAEQGLPGWQAATEADYGSGEAMDHGPQRP
jgi:hypothetical protein